MADQLAVIIPVYKGLDKVRACLESVLQSACKAQFRLLVLFDGGTEAGLKSYLLSLKEQSLIELHINEENLGFPGTVNLGFDLLGDADCIILNSDTLVAAGWVDRITSIAKRDPRIATVTPFTNNGEICSFPAISHDNELPWGHDHIQLDALFQEQLPADAIDVPTGVGFCMYVSRASLELLGGFDLEHFSRGYGEENDYCMRAAAAGFRNVVCTNLFVFHEGGVSYGKEKAALMDSAGENLQKIHPGYGARVAAFLKSDPLRPYRLRAIFSLLGNCEEPVLLVFNHGMGGGTEQYVSELGKYYYGQAHIIVLEPDSSARVVLHLPVWTGCESLYFELEQDMGLLLDLISMLRPTASLVNHVRGMEQHLVAFLEAAACGFFIVLHDYYLISANASLTADDGTYCPARARDLKSRRADISAASGMTLPDWDALTNWLFEEAVFCIAPSEAARDLYRQFYPAANIQFHPHPERELDGAYPPVKVRADIAGRPLRVVVIGALARIKGADVVEDVARLVKRHGDGIEIHLLGYAYRRLDSHVISHGAYRSGDLDELLSDIEADVAWYPNLWPESYSYTLSAAFRLGLPVLVSDIGALSERARGRPLSRCASHDSAPETWLVELRAFAKELGSRAGEAYVWQTQESPQAWYREKFLDSLSTSDRRERVCSPVPIEKLAALTEKQPDFPVGARLRLLKFLNWLRMSPYLGWVSRFIPYRYQRGLKRLLSRKPVQDH